MFCFNIEFAPRRLSLQTFRMGAKQWVSIVSQMDSLKIPLQIICHSRRGKDERIMSRSETFAHDVKNFHVHLTNDLYIYCVVSIAYSLFRTRM